MTYMTSVLIESPGDVHRAVRIGYDGDYVKIWFDDQETPFVLMKDQQMEIQGKIQRVMRLFSREQES